MVWLVKENMYCLSVQKKKIAVSGHRPLYCCSYISCKDNQGYNFYSPKDFTLQEGNTDASDYFQYSLREE